MGLASNATGRLHISVLSKIKQVNWTPKHNQGKIYTLYSMIALWSKAEKKLFARCGPNPRKHDDIVINKLDYFCKLLNVYTWPCRADSAV